MNKIKLLALCALLTMVGGCVDHPVDGSATGWHPNARWKRGGPQGDYDFRLWPDERQRLVRQILSIPYSMTADEVIQQLGEPDSDYEDFSKATFGPVKGRTLTYEFANYRRGLASPDMDEDVSLHFVRGFFYYSSSRIAELPQFGALRPSTVKQFGIDPPAQK